MMLRYAIGAAVGILFLIAFFLGVMLSGLVNVSARYTDPVPLGWLLHTTYHQSVARQADGITAPETLATGSMTLKGARNFENMCMTCHTPPGVSDTPVQQGLNPSPPRLSELMDHKTAAETFWVIKNGVRMTGMPAFGPTHEAKELWALVAFLKRMHNGNASDYQALIAQAEKQLPADDGHGHRHGNETESASQDHNAHRERRETATNNEHEGHSHSHPGNGHQH